MKILVTGGAGFIGSNFIRHILEKYPDYKIINLDSLTYAGNLDSLRDVEEKYGENSPERRYYFIKGDIRDREIVDGLMSKVDTVVHFAAESHVDRSIDNSQEFLSTNVLGTQNLLDLAKKHNIGRFLHISTDEVYGSIRSGFYQETDALTPNSPYSSSKAGADLLVMSYFKTYKFPAIITRTTNNFGPYQHPEKFIPLFITNLIDNREVPIYGYGLNRRDWIYVLDNCVALDAVLHKGREGEIYNIGTNTNELSNIEISSWLAHSLGKPAHLMKFVTDRLGHDFRYGVDVKKINEELDWRHEHALDESLKKTIDWYKENEWWWRNIKEEEFENNYNE